MLTLIKNSINFTPLPTPARMECIITIRIKLEDSYLTVSNIYLPLDTAVDRAELNKLFGPHTVITGDINAKSRLWGTPVPDERCLMFEELVDINNASVINAGQPTYQHCNGSCSHLDVSIVSGSLGARSNWTVLTNTLGSDHSPTVITINERSPFIEADRPPRFKLSKADWAKFKRTSNEKITAEVMASDDSEENARRITESIIEAADRCIPQSKAGQSNRLQHKHVERCLRFDK